MTYKVLYGQTIYDLALATYGNVGFVYQLIQDNPSLISITTTPPPGLEVTWNPALVVSQPQQVASTQAVPSTTQNYTASARQSIYDVCLHTYGTLDYLYTLIQDSNFTNLLTYPLSGQGFKFNPTNIKSNQFFNWLNNNTIVIATAQNGNEVFSEEDIKTIFVSEDGTTFFTPEP